MLGDCLGCLGKIQLRLHAGTYAVKLKTNLGVGGAKQDAGNYVWAMITWLNGVGAEAENGDQELDASWNVNSSKRGHELRPLFGSVSWQDWAQFWAVWGIGFVWVWG